MKTVGIITEYNPFHLGHQYMIEEAKKKSNADRVVVVMSGGFVQRGEPAFFDKWTRAKAALLNGVDMVLELPVLFATANAETFASAAVRILEDSGIVDVLCFGSESGNLTTLQEAAKLMTDETEEFRSLLKSNLDMGMSYPTARSKALETISNINSEILSQPNHILALEYLKALERYKCSMIPMTIRREGCGYHSTSLDNKFASASAIRKGILEDQVAEAFGQVPENCYELYGKTLSLGTAPVLWKNYAGALNYKLRTMSPEKLSQIFEVTEGLENRILRSIDECYEVEDIIDFIKSKRYTRTKIQRILLHILLDIKGAEVSYFMKKIHYPYIRVLGFRKEKADILGDLTMHSKCPVLSNLKKATEILDDDGLHLLALEKNATDLHAMTVPNPIYRGTNQDFTMPMAII
ncbi:nucleotidyltransferase [Anaerotignum sp. MB30-C6]|uniref:nucleotidyltransferase n=1 Tax=Anaerotignum sp. MB30-C6 TaxID=3070814 RepID=UPI0027DBE6EF|nr:nucleotidyltransferase [Anaerotignum sp. MB30-C6]WMI81738.1 nucleotidyltransferase [Anaerotignum sp. MB30-C6]